VGDSPAADPADQVKVESGGGRQSRRETKSVNKAILSIQT
jgi:hypothetical protein